ncbi:MAG: ABC transporter ATP-binding protein [Alphaproteobacteria bacterium]|nr:ABC transporter ATP-binding protein [Alphaproteobacteria bacterium]
MSRLAFERVGKSFGTTEVVRDVSLSVAEGEFAALLGPSGCGKTTLLRMVAGLVAPSTGRVLIGAQDVTALSPDKRGVGLVFQSYALFPHLTVFENVAFGLRRQRVSGAALSERVEAALAMVRLPGLAARRPSELSGGQQQRVAIARAIAPRPRVLLFDEPLSNLDAQLRDEMQIELKRLQRSLGITTLFVTHDQSEALSMADRVCVMAHGVVQQFDTPEAVYHRPATAFVAGFIGRPNRLAGRIAADGRIDLGGGVLLAAGEAGAPGTAVEAIIRQEAISIAGDGDGLPGTIVLRAFNGARVQYVVRLAEGVELVAETASSGSQAGLEPGTPVRLAIAPGAVFALPAA